MPLFNLMHVIRCNVDIKFFYDTHSTRDEYDKLDRAVARRYRNIIRRRYSLLELDPAHDIPKGASLSICPILSGRRSIAAKSSGQILAGAPLISGRARREKNMKT